MSNTIAQPASNPNYPRRFLILLALVSFAFLPTRAKAGNISRFQEYPPVVARQARLTLPCWSPELVPELSWFLADRFDDREALIFPPLKGPSSEVGTLDNAASNLITVFNANLWLLPFPFAHSHGQRLYDTVSLIDRLNPDLVTLQEVWLYAHAEALRTSLPEYWMTIFPLDLFNRGGLVVFSRRQPTRAVYGSFGRTWLHNPVEHLAGKGYLRLTFSEPLTFDLVCTHVYAPKNSYERTISDSQIAHLDRIIRAASAPAVLAGDLNTRVPRLRELLPEGYSWERNLQSRTQARLDGTKIDYLLARPSASISVTIESQPILDPIVSDHLPLIATITFTPQ